MTVSAQMKMTYMSQHLVLSQTWWIVVCKLPKFTSIKSLIRKSSKLSNKTRPLVQIGVCQVSMMICNGNVLAKSSIKLRAVSSTAVTKSKRIRSIMKVSSKFYLKLSVNTMPKCSNINKSQIMRRRLPRDASNCTYWV